MYNFVVHFFEYIYNYIKYKLAEFSINWEKDISFFIFVIIGGLGWKK